MTRTRDAAPSPDADAVFGDFAGEESNLPGSCRSNWN